MVDTPIFLDNAATTRPLPEVAELLAESMASTYGNPSSKHAFGDKAKRLLADAREFLRGSLGAADLVFTSGGTEADYLAVVGAARAREPGRVLCGAADHAAVTALGPQLAYSRHELQTIPVTHTGSIDPERLFDQLGRDVRAVSLLHGHNELGTLLPLDELVSVIRHTAPEAHIHVDLVQAYGKIDFDLDLQGIDSVAVSGHKLHGPRGVGFLATSSKAKLRGITVGGGQEQGLRGGTENVAGATALALAAEKALTHLSGDAQHMAEVQNALWNGIAEEFPDAERLGDPDHRLPHVLSVRIPGAQGELLQQACADRGLCFSTGSACNEGTGHKSSFGAIGLDKRAQKEVVRLSCSADTYFDEVDRALNILIFEAERLRSLAPGSRLDAEAKKPKRSRGGKKRPIRKQSETR